MKNLLIAVIFLLQFLIPSQIFSENNNRPKIGLVLSGGGAKGFAHIGVLEVLEKEGIPIDYIVGTSIGSIIGGLYSIGYNSQQLKEFVQQQEWMDLLSDYLSREYKNAYEKDEEDRYLVSFILNEEDEISFPTGVVQGQNVINTLCKLTAKFHDVEDFSKLPIPFACVAADITSGEEVVLKKGFLAEAIFASMSLPTIFAPPEIDGRLLVDGGIINNYPVDVAKEMGADIIIGVDIQTKPLKKEEILELTDVLGQMFSYMGYEKYRENKENSDILIEPDITGFSTASFSNEAADTLMKRGTVAALRKISDIKKLLNEKNIPLEQKNVKYDYNNDFEISTFMIGGIKNSTIDYTLNKTNFLFPNKYNFDIIDDGIKRLYGSNSFNKAYFRIFGEEHKSLALIVHENNNSKLNAGFNYNSTDNASILINLTFRNQLINGSRLTFDLKFASNPIYHTSFQFSTSFLPELYLGLTYKDLNVDVYDRDGRIAASEINYLKGDFSIIELFGTNYLLNLGVEGEYYKNNPLFSENIELPTTVDENSTLGIFGKINLDNLDDKFYPTRGFDVTAKFNYVSNELNNILENTTTPIITYNIKSAISLGTDLCVIPKVYGRLLLNNNIDVFRYNAIGGTEQTKLIESHLPFIGVNRVVLTRARTMIFGSELRLRLSQNNFISAHYNFATHFNRFRDWQSRELIHGGGIKYSFRSFIGPIEFLLSTSDYNKDLEFFFNIGRWF